MDVARFLADIIKGGRYSAGLLLQSGGSRLLKSRWVLAPLGGWRGCGGGCGGRVWGSPVPGNAVQVCTGGKRGRLDDCRPGSALGQTDDGSVDLDVGRSSRAWTVTPTFTSPRSSRMWCGRQSLSWRRERDAFCQLHPTKQKARRSDGIQPAERLFVRNILSFHLHEI